MRKICAVYGLHSGARVRHLDLSSGQQKAGKASDKQEVGRKALLVELQWEERRVSQEAVSQGDWGRWWPPKERNCLASPQEGR